MDFTFLEIFYSVILLVCSIRKCINLKLDPLAYVKYIQMICDNADVDSSGEDGDDDDHCGDDDSNVDVEDDSDKKVMIMVVMMISMMMIW